MGPHARGGAPRLEVTRRWVTEIACPGFTSTRSAARTSSACLRSLARPDVGARRAAPRGDSEMSLRILLADDHVIVRQGVKNLLVGEGYKVVGEATDGREAVRLAQVLQPDIAILDLSMPLLNGLGAACEILKVSRRTKPILLTLHREAPFVTEAIRLGIKAYVVKTQAAADLFEAIRVVARGETYMSPNLFGVTSPERANVSLSSDPLSRREREILQLVAEGKSTKEIADLLGISFNTVESHRTRLMDKLNIHERAGLVRYAVRRGLIQP